MSNITGVLDLNLPPALADFEGDLFKISGNKITGKTITEVPPGSPCVFTSAPSGTPAGAVISANGSWIIPATTNAPPSTTVNRAVKVVAANSAGDPVTAQIVKVGETISSSNGVTGSFTPSSSVAFLASVTVPYDGIYAVHVQYGFNRKLTSGYNSTSPGTISNTGYVMLDGNQIWNNGSNDIVALFQGMILPSNTDLPSPQYIGQIAIAKMTTGQVLTLNQYIVNNGALISASVQYNIAVQPKITITRLAENHLTVV